jgi:hypothetical protein
MWASHCCASSVGAVYAAMNSVRIARVADWKVAAAMDVGDCDGPSWWTARWAAQACFRKRMRRRVHRSRCRRAGLQAAGSPAMMTSGVAGGELPSSMAAQSVQSQSAAGRASGQSSRTWVVVAMVSTHAGHRQQACRSGLPSEARTSRGGL